jgi:hypothetical protein
MNVAIFGSFGKRLLAPGWKKETAFAALGGGEFDLSDAPPGDHARQPSSSSSAGSGFEWRQAQGSSSGDTKSFLTLKSPN